MNLTTSILQFAAWWPPSELWPRRPFLLPGCTDGAGPARAGGQRAPKGSGERPQGLRGAPRAEGGGSGLPSARRYSSKFSLVSIFQYPVKSTGISGGNRGRTATKRAGTALGSAGAAATDATRLMGGREMCALRGQGAPWGGDSWIPSTHKARGRIHCSRRSSPLSGAGAGTGAGDVGGLGLSLARGHLHSDLGFTSL